MKSRIRKKRKSLKMEKKVEGVIDGRPKSSDDETGEAG